MEGLTNQESKMLQRKIRGSNDMVNQPSWGANQDIHFTRTPLESRTKLLSNNNTRKNKHTLDLDPGLTAIALAQKNAAQLQCQPDQQVSACTTRLLEIYTP
jgi:hypothetical protein